MYQPETTRYDSMQYNRCGRSGLKLPAISLGLWFNFGGVDSRENARAMLRRAFDLGITHFDIANNYGPPPGSAEDTMGWALRNDFASLRDEIILSTKAGYGMWSGPYGDFGSRKYLVSSLDQSLRRLGVEYVDIFYHHRPDPETPLEETMRALDHIVRSGKALYAGISNYSPDQTAQAAKILRELGTPCIIHQPKYNMFHREPEAGLLGTLAKEGIGCIVFSPLSQGLLTDKYLGGIPEQARVTKANVFIHREDITEQRLTKVRQLNEIAKRRGQTLAELAIAWVLRRKEITSAIVGASRVSQIEDAVGALRNTAFTDAELLSIDKILDKEEL
jgi:L-glyceraldehyde 3-phosphate reductase